VIVEGVFADLQAARSLDVATKTFEKPGEKQALRQGSPRLQSETAEGNRERPLILLR
jgi:hypothetical protein